MPKYRFTPIAPDVWQVVADGTPVDITITVADTLEAKAALVEFGRTIKLGEGAEVYLPHFRAYSEATNARQETPKEALPAEVSDKLEEAAAFLRELKVADRAVGPR